MSLGDGDLHGLHRNVGYVDEFYGCGQAQGELAVDVRCGTDGGTHTHDGGSDQRVTVLGSHDRTADGAVLGRTRK